MRRFRRHIGAIALATIGAQSLALVLGIARACGPLEHTHGGIAAPECVMHHQDSPLHHQRGEPAAPAAQHEHHHASAPTEQPVGGPSVTCGCPGDVLALLSGPIGVMVLLTRLTAPIELVTFVPTNGWSTIDVVLPPLFPPPRTDSSRLS